VLDDGTYDTVENVANLVNSATASPTVKDRSPITRTPTLPPRLSASTTISATSVDQQSTAESQRGVVMDANSVGGHADTGAFVCACVLVCFGF